MENNSSYDISKANAEREKALQEMLKNGELSSMTEVAYGTVIAGLETEKPVIEKKPEEKK